MRYGWNADSLPRWPFALPFVAYPLAWLVGIGDLIWPMASVIMLAIMVRSRRLRVPSGSVTWMLFLVWVISSFVALDTFGRVVGAAFRLSLYMAATVLALYLYNSWRTLSLRFATGTFTIFLATVTVGGYLAMIFPRLSLTTPLYAITPPSLRSNELISEMIVRRTTQWAADAWIPQQPRPSAPFVYANTWGNVYSLLLPLALVYLASVWNTRRRIPVLLLILASLVPAAATLNRGMYIGLAIIVAWYLMQAFRRRAIQQIFAVLAAACAAFIAIVISPMGERLSNRVATTSSTEDRAQLYISTIVEVLSSPIFGFGAPRPAALPWLPSLGTQGQVWTVLFSHGFVGAVLFISFLVSRWIRAVRRVDPAGAVFGGIILASIVESTYYGMMTGIMVTFVAIALAERADAVIKPADPIPRLRSGDRSD